MEKSVLGGLFDLNRDGKLDTWEQAAELMFIHDIVMGASEDGVDPEPDEFDEDDLDDLDLDLD